MGEILANLWCVAKCFVLSFGSLRLDVAWLERMVVLMTSYRTFLVVDGDSNAETTNLSGFRSTATSTEQVHHVTFNRGVVRGSSL
jgi:hypothetical protein